MLNLARARPWRQFNHHYTEDILSVLRIGLEAIGTLIFLRRLLTRGTGNINTTVLGTD